MAYGDTHRPLQTHLTKEEKEALRRFHINGTTILSFHILLTSEKTTDEELNGSCIRAHGIAFDPEVRVTVGDGLRVTYFGAEFLCIMKGALKVEILNRFYSYVAVECYLPVDGDEQQHLASTYSPIPLLRSAANSKGRYPTLVPLTDILELVHLPHACNFQQGEAPSTCMIERGIIRHNDDNAYVVYNNLLVEHELYKVNNDKG